MAKKIKINDVVVLKLGVVNRNNVLIDSKSVFKFPKKCDLTLGYDDNKILGKAKNFRQEDDKIICDLEVNKEEFEKLADKGIYTVGPKYETKIVENEIIDDKKKIAKVKDGKIINMSYIPTHAHEDLVGNVKKAMPKEEKK